MMDEDERAMDAGKRVVVDGERVVVDGERVIAMGRLELESDSVFVGERIEANRRFKM